MRRTTEARLTRLGAEVKSAATPAEARQARDGIAARVVTSRAAAHRKRRARRRGWPRNVRERVHEIERSLVFEDDELGFGSRARAEGVSAAPASVSPAFQTPAGFVFDEVRDAVVVRALRRSEVNVPAVARLRGVTRDHVRYRLNEKAPGGSPGA